MIHFSTILANLSYVAPDLARCMQPFTRPQWNRIHKKHGFKSIVNLRGPNPKAPWYNDEIEAAKSFECIHVDLMLSSKRLPSREDLIKLLDYYHDLPKPMLIKCSGGADRTGLASGLYLLNEKGIEALPEALSYLRLIPYLHYAKPQQRWIREFFNFYEDTHKDLTLREWLEDTYSKEVFKDRLIAMDKGDYWRRGWK